MVMDGKHLCIIIDGYVRLLIVINGFEMLLNVIHAYG